jgi:hypothetical protein
MQVIVRRLGKRRRPDYLQYRQSWRTMQYLEPSKLGFAQYRDYSRWIGNGSPENVPHYFSTFIDNNGGFAASDEACDIEHPVSSSRLPSLVACAFFAPGQGLVFLIVQGLLKPLTAEAAGHRPALLAATPQAE